MKHKNQNILKPIYWAEMLLILLSLSSNSFAQRNDSLKVSIKPKTSSTLKTLATKGKANNFVSQTQSNSSSEINNHIESSKNTDKIISVTKIYPIPVKDQININFKLSKEINLTIKITDLLGNDVMTLTNEKYALGEYSKSFNISSKLNPGIYFLRIVAGGEPLIKRISVL